jgi:hypothetical protein
MFYSSKKKETDKKSVSSASVPLTELFSEPFLRDLDLNGVLIRELALLMTEIGRKGLLPIKESDIHLI